MILAYVSRTKNIEKIVKKLNLPEDLVIDINLNSNLILDKDFCLLTYTDMLGKVPKIVSDFLEKNKFRLKAVAGSGNRNFGENFCGAAKKIHQMYGVPLWAEFELAGDENSIEIFRKKLLSNN